jgi:hypothetical protein
MFCRCQTNGSPHTAAENTDAPVIQAGPDMGDGCHKVIHAGLQRGDLRKKALAATTSPVIEPQIGYSGCNA